MELEEVVGQQDERQEAGAGEEPSPPVERPAAPSPGRADEAGTCRPGPTGEADDPEAAVRERPAGRELGVDERRGVLARPRELHRHEQRAERDVHAEQHWDGRPNVPAPQLTEVPQPAFSCSRGLRRPTLALSVGGDRRVPPRGAMLSPMSVAWRVVGFAVGALLVFAVLDAAVRTFVVPRGIVVRLTRAVFLAVRLAFDVPLRWAKTYDGRDRVMAMYAPLTLLILPAVWLVLVLSGFTLMFRAVDVAQLRRRVPARADRRSSRSGSSSPTTCPASRSRSARPFIGLGLLALLIAYLPDDLRRVLAPRGARRAHERRAAGIAAVGRDLLVRPISIGWLENLNDLWVRVAALVRRARGDPHLAAPPRLPALAGAEPLLDHRRGAVLDAAALVTLSTVDVPTGQPHGRAAASGPATSRCGRSPSFFRIDRRSTTRRRPTRSASPGRSGTRGVLAMAEAVGRAARRGPRAGLAGLRGLAGELRHRR